MASASYLPSNSFFALVELLEQDDLLAGDAVFAVDGILASDTELVVVQSGGDLQEGFGGIGGLVLEESDDSDLVVFDELLGGVDVGQCEGWGSGLLLQPGDDAVGCSAATVLSGLAVAEELECGVALDVELLGQLAVFGGVYLAQHDLGVLLGQSPGGLGVLRGESLAMSTPRSVEFYQNVFMFSDGTLEVVFGEDQNALVLLNVRGSGKGK